MLKALMKEARAGRVRAPLAERPMLARSLLPVSQGWAELSRQRRKDMGEPLRITGEAIDSLLVRQRITDPELRATWHRWIGAMEDAFFEWIEARRKETRDADALPRAQH